jgi:hypothetical protein
MFALIVVQREDQGNWVDQSDLMSSKAITAGKAQLKMQSSIQFISSDPEMNPLPSSVMTYHDSEYSVS